MNTYLICERDRRSQLLLVTELASFLWKNKSGMISVAAQKLSSIVVHIVKK